MSIQKEKSSDPAEETYYSRQKFAPAVQTRSLKLRIKKLSTEKSQKSLSGESESYRAGKEQVSPEIESKVAMKSLKSLREL